MNGDINGIMAESEEVALPISSSPNHKADETKVTQEDCDEDKNDCENSINGESCDASDNESINSTADISLPGGSTAEHSQDLDSKPALITDTNSENVTHKTDTITKENHCEDSNGPDPESKNELRTENTNENSKDKNSVKINGPPNEVCQDSMNEDGMEYDSMAEEGSAISGDARAEDTVSITSDSESGDDSDETSEESESKNKISDIIVLDNENRVSSNNSDVHEIDSDNENDDCVIDNEKKKPNEPEDKVQLRRSSRAVKRKRYPDDVTAVKNGDESDVEEVEPVDPLKRKAKPIVINDTKTLVAMAAKEMRSDDSNNKKKETTVLIIDSNSASKKTNSMQQSKSSVSSNNSTIAQNLYQSIAARGTTVTPISNQNNNNATQTSQNATPAILPSLTDDMFVVEAPSFIVPYVYEKPSITAFREFVDKLGKQLEEEKLKEEMKEKEKREKEKEKREKEKQERRERGEEVHSDDGQQSEPKVTTEEEANNKRKAKKNQRRMNEEDDASWDGESLSESDEEVMSDENDKIVVKDKVEAIDHINVVADLTADKICSSKLIGKSSMDCSLGKFFINIGLNLVQEYVQSDLLKQQNRKLYKEKKAGHSTKATETSIAQLMKNLEFSKENNAPYRFRQEKCEFCSFKTESKLIMAQHLETPHMNKNNIYKCNFCTFEIRSPHDILYHMESVHNVRGRLERAPSYNQCANCPFEDNGKGKMARHLIACAKKFKPESNLAPPVDWEPPAKIPKIAKPRNNVMSPYQNAFNRSAMGAAIRGPLNMGSPVAAANAGYKPRGRSPAAVPRPPPVHGLPIMRAPSMARSSALNMPNNFSVANNSKPKSTHQPSISITPLPRQPTPNQHQQPTNVAGNKNSFVICEICDGYIKDLEQLRNHMQWIHKVKIHPKMIYNRPPLNCQKCQFRFFTDQGFERHLLGSHGLVTSSMQEAANKGKDAGRCPVCGRVYQWKLLNHVARDHNLTLKPGHLSYKCTVCTATFGMYKQFENHVYSAHSVVAKKVMDKNKSAPQPAKSNSDTLLKPLKINEDITIIPQSVKSMAAKSAKEK